MTTFTLPARDHPVDSTTRLWSASGVAAGLLAIVGIAATTQVGFVYDPSTAGDARAIQAAVDTVTGVTALFHACTLASAFLLIVFTAGLRRRLEAKLPDSVIPGVVSAGLGLVAVVQVIGTALDTEFMTTPREPIVASASVFWVHWINTVPFVWAGSGLAALGLAVASLRHRWASRWIGVASLVLGALISAVALSPLQYLAGFLGPLWLLVISSGLLLTPRNR